MGCCFSKSKLVQIGDFTNSTFLSNLSVLHAEIVQIIIKLHNINSISNFDFEALILQKNKGKAILLKKKISIINLKIQEFQEYLEILGRLERENEITNQSKQVFLSECKMIVELFRDNHLLSTNTEFLLDNSNAIMNLENELRKYSIDENELNTEIDALLKSQENSLTINEGFQRKRYIRTARLN